MMSPDKTNNDHNTLLSNGIRFHQIVNAVLSLTLLFAILLLAYSMFQQRNVALISEGRFSSAHGAHYANKDYLMDMAGYVLGMVLTVTPETVDHNNGVILKMADPNRYPILKMALDNAALRLKQERAMTVWVPYKEEMSDLRVQVSGRLKTFVANKLASERDKDYLVEFNVLSSGRLYVSKIEEVILHDGIAAITH